MDINEVVIRNILDNIPKNIKPVNFIIEKLEISKESAYRRLRGDIAFTLDELTKLSSSLVISVDKILGTVNDEDIFFSIPTGEYSSSSSFKVTLDKYYEYILNLSRARNVEVFLALNQVIYPLVIGYDHLFKLLYYRWMHQMGEISGKVLFSEIEFPSDIIEINNKILHYKSMVRSQNTFIIDQNVFVNVMKWIQYYYKRKLIDENEILLLKNDMLNIFSRIEQQAHKEFDGSRSVNYYFLSMFNIESNSIYTCYDDKMLSSVWIAPTSTIQIFRSDVCTNHKKWIDSLRRFSILITQSNDILLGKFINKQREYLDLMCSYSEIKQDPLSFHL